MQCGLEISSRQKKFKMIQIIPVICVDSLLWHLKESQLLLLFKKPFLVYFDVLIADQDKGLALYKVYTSCVTKLRDDGFFVVKTFVYNAKNKHKIVYPSVPSAVIPVPYSDELPLPVFHESPSNYVLQELFCSILPVHERPKGEYKDIEHLTENSSDSDDTVFDTDFDNIPAVCSTSSMAQPECFHQRELSDLDLFLSKELAELLASRLSEKHVFELGTNISFCRHSDEEYGRYFQEEAVFVTSINIRQLLSELSITFSNPDEWRIFIEEASYVSFITMVTCIGQSLWAIP